MDETWQSVLGHDGDEEVGEPEAEAIESWLRKRTNKPNGYEWFAISEGEKD